MSVIGYVCSNEFNQLIAWVRDYLLKYRQFTSYYNTEETKHRFTEDQCGAVKSGSSCWHSPSSQHSLPREEGRTG